MAQNITLLGASYSDVPAVKLPKTGGGTAQFTDTSDTTATAGDVASGKYFYTAAGAKAQGSYVAPSAVSQATPTISVNTSTGLITASSTQSAGVVSAGTTTATEQLTTQAAQTLYPSTTDQTISSGKFLTGTQTFKGVLLTNLTAGNIKKDVVVKVGDSADDDRITSVTGTYEGGGGGSTAAPEKDVNFIDYDGTILYSYTKAEFASLSAMPANPSHDGLTAQGWNWSLSDAKTYVAANGKLWIGQMYVTSSGDTEIDCDFADAGLLTPYLNISVNGTVEVDWGDGSATDTITGTSLTTQLYMPHTYATTGNYTISINVASGSFRFYNTNVLSNTNSSGNASRRYNASVKEVRVGNGITQLGSSAFNNCYSLQRVTIPYGITLVDESAFYGCYSLQSVTIPNGVGSVTGSSFYNCSSLQRISFPSGVTSFDNSAFRGCSSLQRITIPSTVTSLGNYEFYSCPSLQSVTIPSGVTSIGTYAFYNDYSLYKLVFKPTSPPTVANSNAFHNLPTDCIIYVPSGSLTSYTSANNYPSSSTYTYREET